MSSPYQYNVRCNGVEYDGSRYFVTSTPREVGPDTINIVENGSIAIESGEAVQFVGRRT
jgi:hypothetical protein